jgi:hypothetical protein
MIKCLGITLFTSYLKCSCSVPLIVTYLEGSFCQRNDNQNHQKLGPEPSSEAFCWPIGLSNIFQRMDHVQHNIDISDFHYCYLLCSYLVNYVYLYVSKSINPGPKQLYAGEILNRFK